MYIDQANYYRKTGDIMKEISKAEFIRRITNGKSLFIGISPAMDDSEINTVRQRRLNAKMYVPRTCIAKSNGHLVFSNDSHLYLADVKPHTFIKCYATEDDVLVVEHKWFDINWQGNIEDIRYKYLYYTMA